MPFYKDESEDGIPERGPGHSAALLVFLLGSLSVTLALPQRGPGPGAVVSPPGRAREQIIKRVTLVSKVIGTSINDPPGVTIAAGNLDHVFGADLGAVTLYQGRWYFVLGDTAYVPAVPWQRANFLVASAPYTAMLSRGITVDSYLNLHQAGQDRAPYRALKPDPGSAIPNALFTVSWRGRSAMFAQYMVGGNFGGHDHWSAYSGIARYDDRAGIFRPYKPDVYLWKRGDRPGTNAERLQYNFGSSSFWADQGDGYLYMVGSPTNRFGGVKLARLPLSSLLDPGDHRPWEYYLGSRGWWLAAGHEEGIDPLAPWLIPPRDARFSLEKNYATARYAPGTDQCTYLTVGEFSVLYDAYRQRWLLLTASAGCRPNVLDIYTAPRIEGPWTAQPEQVTMPFTTQDPNWDYYAPYTTPAFAQEGGRVLYFVASTYAHYGIYLYRAEL